jgi:hypothetical protein
MGRPRRPRLTMPLGLLSQTGRLRAQRKRKADHEPVKGAHHRSVERGPGQYVSCSLILPPCLPVSFHPPSSSKEARLHIAAALLPLFVHLPRRSDLPLPTPPRLDRSSIIASCTSPPSTRVPGGLPAPFISDTLRVGGRPRPGCHGSSPAPARHRRSAVMLRRMETTPGL